MLQLLNREVKITMINMFRTLMWKCILNAITAGIVIADRVTIRKKLKGNTNKKAKNTVMEMKNALEGLMSRMHTAKEKSLNLNIYQQKLCNLKWKEKRKERVRWKHSRTVRWCFLRCHSLLYQETSFLLRMTYFTDH